MAWSVLQCAVQGRSHVASATPCQDKTFVIVKDDCTVSALADGAGSASFSHFGAEAVTKEVCEYIATNFDSLLADNDGVNVKQRILATVGDCLQKLSKEKKCSVKDLASTLLFVAEKSGMFVICHIGDGVIGYLKEGKVMVASHPENGEFANTTVFTTSGSAITTMKLLKGSTNQISGFVLMSDGTENSFYNKREKRLSSSLARLLKLTAICDESVMEERLLQVFENLVKHKTTDDCSIVLMAYVATGVGFHDLSKQAKCDTLELPQIRKSFRRLEAFDSILGVVKKWVSPSMIAHRLHLRPKKVQRCLRRLNKAGLLQTREDGFCKSALKDV